MDRWNPSSLLDTMPSNENGFCSSPHSFVGNTSLVTQNQSDMLATLYIYCMSDFIEAAAELLKRLGFD